MATAKENYTKLKAFISAFPRNIESKKDLLKLKDKTLLKKYYIYRAYFKIDNRLKPSNVIAELKRFKERNIYFKSEQLGIDLTKNNEFNDTDKYTSSSKIIAKVTDAMLNTDIKLHSVHTEFKNIDVRYKVTESKKCVVFDTNNDLEFFNYLPDDYRVNIWQSTENGKINKSSYNKTGLDFLFDYHNQSNDFATQLAPIIDEKILFIYKR